jgi:hypothetical protein
VILSPGTVIPANDSFVFYLVNNTGGAASITLPPANVEGKRLVIYAQFTQCGNVANAGEPGNCGSHTITTQLNLLRQGTDMILNQSNALVAAAPFNRFAELISHGNIWYMAAGY